MKASQLIFATPREDPSDAEIVSHKLMIRAGLIRQEYTFSSNSLMSLFLTLLQ